MSDLNLVPNDSVVSTEVVGFAGALQQQKETAEFNFETHAKYNGKIYDKGEYLNRKFVELKHLLGNDPGKFPTKAIDGHAVIIAKDQWISVTPAVRNAIREILEIDENMTLEDMNEAFEMFQESGGRLMCLVGTRFVNTKTEDGVIVECETRTDQAIISVFSSLDEAEVKGSDEVKNFLTVFNAREAESAKRMLAEATLRIQAQKMRDENARAQKAKMAELRAKRKQAPETPSAETVAETEEVFEDSIEPAI